MRKFAGLVSTLCKCKFAVLLAKGLCALVACSGYFIAILLLSNNVYGPVLGNYAGLVSFGLVLLPAVIMK